MMFLLLIVALVAVAIGTWLCKFRPLNKDELEVWRTFVAKREPFLVVINEMGELRPRDVEVIPGPMDGEIVWLIPEGTYVKKGDKIAVIDDRESRERVDLDGFNLKATEARLRREELELELTEKTLALDLKLAEIELKRAKLELKELVEAPTPTDLKTAKLKAEKAAFQRDIAKHDCEAKLTLCEKGIVSNSDVVRARLIYQQAQAAYDQAQAEYELTAMGSPEEDIKIARQRVKQAEIKVQEIKKTSAVQLDLKRTSLAVVEAEANLTRESLERHQRILKSAIVYAPLEGTVLYDIQWGRPEEGKRAWKGDPFLDIVNLSKMVVDTRVNEVDIRLLGLGQKAVIRLEAFPEKEFHGVVTRIAGLATDRGESGADMGGRAISGVMVFDVVVEIEEADPALRPTMTANLEIIVDRIDDAISVPYRAVVESEDKELVYVMKDGKPSPKTVTTGVAGASRIVIEEGLEEGDVVCVLKRQPATR